MLSYVFGNTLVVEDIGTARKLGIGKIKMATLDGNIAESSGVMRGGFIARKSSLGFKEKDSMQELEKLDNEIAELQGVISNVEDKRNKNLEEISTLRNKKAEYNNTLDSLKSLRARKIAIAPPIRASNPNSA